MKGKCIMFSHSASSFPQRHNRDGSYDSICISCFAAVASVRNEADLAQREQDHICDLVLLGYAGQSFRVPPQHSSEQIHRAERYRESWVNSMSHIRLKIYNHCCSLLSFSERCVGSSSVESGLGCCAIYAQCAGAEKWQR